jgi:hypothetical protein
VTKLLLILIAAGALANSLAPRAEPPLLIDSHPAAAPITSLDESN